MKTSGISVCFRIDCTISKILSVVTPPDRARTFAAWITGPSAVGSEKGIPSSIRSAPASSMAYTSFSVTSKDGSPQVMKGMNAFSLLNASAILLLIDILPSVAGDGRTVFVSPPGNGDHHDLVFSHGGNQLSGIGHRMGAFDGRDNPFDTRQILE